MRHTVLVVVLLLGACSGDESPSPVRTSVSTTGESAMNLTSPSFAHEENIPTRYTCDGDDVSPPLELEAIPAGTVTLALVMDDPDAPVGVWDHWVAYDIEPQPSIPEAVASLGTPGTNSWDRTGYGGPCPPGGTHRYFFTVYALDTSLELAAGANKADVLDALQGHVLGEATLMGRYSR